MGVLARVCLSWLLLAFTCCIPVWGSNDLPAARTLRFLGDDQLAPYVWLDNGKPVGLVVDLALAAAQRASLDIRIETADSPLAQTMLREGKVDALLQIYPSAESERVFDFSRPVLESSFHLFRRTDRPEIQSLASLVGKRIGVEAGSLPQQYLTQSGQIVPVVIASKEKGFEMLEAGQLDAIFMERWVGEYELQRKQVEGVIIVEPPIIAASSRIAVRKGNPELLARIDAGLLAIEADGTRGNILHKWRGKEIVYVTRESMVRTLGVLSTLLLVISGTAIACGIKMRRANGLIAQRERALEAEIAERISATSDLHQLHTIQDQRVAERTAELEAEVQTLRETEQRFRLALKNAPVSVAIQDRELRYVWAYNQRTARPEEIIGHTDADIFTAAEATRFEALKRRVLEEGTEQHEQMWFDRPGGRVFFDVYWEPVRDDQGQIIGVASATINLTPLKLAEEALRESEERLRALWDNIPDRALYAYAHEADGSTRFHYISKGIEHLTGIPAQDVLRDPQALHRQVLPEYLDYVLECEKRSAEDLAVFDVEIPQRRSDGEIRRMRLHSRPERKADGSTVWYGVQIDVTERQADEAALRDSEARLQLGVEVAELALAEIDYPNGMIHLTAQAARLFGLGEAPVVVPREAIHATFHPADHAHLMSVISASLAPDGPGFFSLDHRIVRPDGEVRWLRVRKQVSFADELLGRRPARAILAALDVTAEHIAADALRQSEQFKQAVLDAMPNQVAVLDQNGVIVAVNEPWQRFAKENSLPPDEVATRHGVGANYLEACATAVRTGFGEGSVQALNGIRAVMSGVIERFSLDYPCHTHDRQRWFTLNVMPVPGMNGGVLVVHTDISERVLHELQRAQLAAIVEQSEDAIISKLPDGTVTSWNRAAEQMFGFTADEVVGRADTLLVPPERLDEEQRTRDALRRQEKVGHFDTVRLRRDGTAIDVSVSVSQIRDGGGHVVGTSTIVRDITARKQTEAALRESEERFRRVFEHAVTGMAVTDMQGRFQRCNPAYSALLGYTENEFRKRSFVGLVHPEDQPATAAVVDRLVKGEIAHFEIENRCVRKEGQAVWVHNYVSCLPDENGKPAHIMALVTNITARRNTEVALQTAKEAAEAATQAKSQFLANMSHEIRTPMNAIVGMTELCLTTHPEERQRNLLEKILLASEALERIIDDILDFSKIEAGKLEMETLPFSLVEVLDNLTSMLSEKARAKGLAWEIQVAPSLAERVYLGDPLRLGQVLNNLAGNAIKFSQQGAVRISIEEVEREGDRVTLHFAVCDEGIGLSGNQLAKLFQPFTQADVSTTRQFGGTGLGLAISQRLVHMMDGRIWVNSTSGQGSSFHFTGRFPVSDQTPPKVSLSVKSAEHLVIERLRGAEILLVEDTELNQEVISDFLGQAGVRVRLAANGEEALGAVAEKRPDCILMDCQMPVMDGYEASRRLRQDPDLRDLPIIALTANALASDRQRCLDAGMDDYLSKPVRQAELLAALTHWIPQPRSAAGATPDPSPAEILRSPGLPPLVGIDTHAGLALVGGRIEFYRKLLRRFRDEHLTRLESRLREALASGERETAIRVTHTLGGLCRTLGADRLGELAAEMERTMSEGDAAAIEACLSALLTEAANMASGLSALDDASPATQVI